MRHPDIVSPRGGPARTGPLNFTKTYRYRVAAAPAIAQPPYVLFVRGPYTGTMRDALAVAVDCYAGARGEETPRRFTLENRVVEVREIVDQWRTPDHRYFKVKTAVGENYTLRHEVKSGVWELAEV